MELKTLQLISRFSLPPNSLGFCGRDSAPEKFKSCVIEGKCKGVEEEIERFIVLHPYLKTISKIINKPKFSYNVVEAYWLGNNELKKTQNEDYKLLLKNFEEQGVSELLIKDLEKNPPKKFIPMHLFQVLNAGAGRSAEFKSVNIENVNNCMIRWGKVKKVKSQEATIELNSLEKEDESYRLVKKTEKAKVVPGFVPGIKKGSVAAVHWNQTVKLLTKEEVKKISFWTSKVLKSI